MELSTEIEHHSLYQHWYPFLQLLRFCSQKVRLPYGNQGFSPLPLSVSISIPLLLLLSLSLSAYVGISYVFYK